MICSTFRSTKSVFIVVFVVFVLCDTFNQCNSLDTDKCPSSNEVISNGAQKANLRALSVNDPNSFSNPEDVRAENIDIIWDVDFENKVVNGSVLYNLVASRPGVEKIIFDIRDLKIHDIKDAECKSVPYEIGQSFLTMGKPLTVYLPPFVKDPNGTLRGNIRVVYETSPNSTALQWLAKEMTQEKQFPFLYSQSEAIHGRSLFPCQDTPFTKATYSAAVTAPKEAIVLFSAVSTGEPQNVSDSKRLHTFVQKVPVQSYLVAFAVGHLVSADIGPRSKVWAEKSFIEDAAFDFSDTEQMIQAAESIVGEYVWGRYDILVLPPSFPYGGMENPCLTFVSPFLLTHDKSLAYVIAHEIAHGWTGNLVTNVNFEHFWLNEGFTVFLERKILAIIQNEQERQFASIQGWTNLEDELRNLGEDNALTKLVLDLKGVDPDDSFNWVPYEKGYVFLYYLEQKVGGEVAMNGFLRHYVETFKYKSIDSFAFKNNFIKYFEEQGKRDLIKDVDWDSWFCDPGTPKEMPKYDMSLYEACINLSNRWMNWNESTPHSFSPSDLKDLSASQVQGFLQELIASNDSLSIAKVEAMEDLYKLNSNRNVEIKFRWFRIGLKAKWLDQLPKVLQFLADVGRIEYLRPLYSDLYDWEEVRAQAISTFLRNRPNMMYVSAYAVAQELHLDEKNDP